VILNILFLLLAIAPFAAAAETPCEKLKLISLAGATITSAESISAGSFRPQDIPDGLPRPVFDNLRSALSRMQLPAYCRVVAVLRPSQDSHIEMAVWMPASDWNGKLEVIGNGGWAGHINFPEMAFALQEGYATSSTDTGHKGDNVAFAPGHPEKVVDFAHRAVHDTTVKSKAILAAYYSRSQRLSFWNGCSGGGRQGLMAAQRYPEDFDGIIAGAPANNKIHMNAWQMALQTAIDRNPASAVPTAKIALLSKAVLATCDALEGIKDGLLADPLQCRFDPATLLCRGSDADDCLTASQVEAVRMAYAPAKKRTGQVIFPGLPPGSELGWQMLAGNGPLELSLGTFRSVLHEDAKWDWRTFDLDRDTSLADEKFGYMDAIAPDLTAFKARGGKLLMYHGWNDPMISAQNSIDYYSSVLAKMGRDQGAWLRLFMVPGMGHCRGGPGPTQFNALGALERWREGGVAPDQMIAVHVTDNRVDMTRPLCPYPQVAAYKGVGSTNDAASFVCKAP
jgi:feruloyl esterase